jgi:tRNA G18 (ribose-2'-O)-methylase SpoU
VFDARAPAADGQVARETDAVRIDVDDPADPRLADYTELTDPAARRRRERDDFFVAEGPVAVERVLASGHRIRSVLISEPKWERVSSLVGELDAPVYVAPREIVAATVGFDLHRGVVAVADRRPLASLDDVVRVARRIAVLEGLNDPENLGAIARSARALGVDALVLDPTCMDPYARRTVRVSMGEVLMLPVARPQPWHDVLAQLHRCGFETWALTPDPTADDLWTLDVPASVAVVLGAEGSGLDGRTLASATRRVRIPIAADVDSLNVAAAAAIAFAATGTARTAGRPAT